MFTQTEEMLKYCWRKFPGIRPFENKKILDVGCGGGILSESLCRLGGDVLGTDFCENSIK